MKITFIVLLFFTVNSFALEINSDLGKITTQCGVKGATKHVWIFKQWHLSPNTDTTKTKVVPQEENQTAIYRQIDEWIKDKRLHTVISEGCSGKIDEKFPQKFNGWNFENLQRASHSTDYDKIVTLVPLKLEAKYGDKIIVPCGDDEALIKDQSLAFSDARGTVGFLVRLKEFKDQPDRAKPYLENIIALDHLSQATSTAEAISQLEIDLKKFVSKIKEDFTKRNEKFFQSIKAQDDKDMALVIGGIHSEGLVPLLREAKIDCTVIEPKGYHADDEKILSEMNKIIEN